MIKAYDENGEVLFEQECQQTFETLGLSGESVVEFVSVDKEEILQTNKEQRGIEKVTDVLSFPYLDEIKAFNKENYPFDYDESLDAVVLGSIMICYDVAVEQASEYGHSVEREKSYLFVHGLLHLLGYDHMDDQEKAQMRQKEEEILTAINIVR